MLLDDGEELFLVLLLPFFKYLLEDVVPELILSEVDALGQQGLEDGLLSVGLPVLDDRLDCSRAVLVPGPPCGLVEAGHDFLLGGEVGVVVVAGNADRVVAVVLLFGLEAQSGLGKRGTCGSCWPERECPPQTSCEMTSRSRTCRARGRSG